MQQQPHDAGTVGAVSNAPSGVRDDYRALFVDAPEPYLLTSAEGTILLANERAHELFDDAELVGRPIHDFVHADDHDGLAEQVRRATRGDSIHSWEVRLCASAREPRVLASIEPAGGDDSPELRWVLWDAMPLELVRERLHRLLDDSQGDAAALRALAEWQATLLGAAAQDMRTPLQVIGSTIDSLLEDGAAMGTPIATSMLERASRQVVRLRRLLPTLLQLGRLQLEGPSAERETVDVRDLINDVLHDLEPVDHVVELDLGVEQLHADPRQLARVLVELISHVTEHGPPAATLRLGSIARGVDAEVHLDVDGYEMQKSVQEVVFSPFLGTGRGGEEANGEDLGLSLVAVFARMHGGRAWIENAPNGGTSFRVLLSNAVPDTVDDPV